jgi:gluconolactonase
LRVAVARALVLSVVMAAASAAAKEPRVVSGFKNPESVLALDDGRILVSQIGEFGRDGDGSIAAIDKAGKITVFASGLNDPKGLAREGQFIYAADRNGVWKIDAKGNAKVFVDAQAFPKPPKFLNDLVVDGNGNVYVSDSGDMKMGGGGAIYKIDRGGRVSTVVSAEQDGRIKSPSGLLIDRGSLLVVDFASGELLRVGLNPLTVKKLAEGFGGGDGVAQDPAGTVYVSDRKGGRVFRVDVKQAPAETKLFGVSFQAAADIAFDAKGKFILVPDMKAGTVTWLPK